jgi:hypothetical protein
VRTLLTHAFIVITLTAAASPAAAQSRPLVTEDPETVPSGFMLVEAGFDFLQDATFPASGLTGRLWRVGSFGLGFGVSPIAEIQFDGGLRNRLSISSREPAPLSEMLDVPGTSTGDVEDLVIGAKVRFLSETEGRPAIALRFSTRLPNASNESGLGLDTTDFNFGIAIGKTVQSIRVVANFGLGILGDPTRGDRQNDVLNYGLSVARAVRTGIELVGEVNGRISTREGQAPVGTESRSIMRVGARYTTGPVRVDAAFLTGFTSLDPTAGFTIGLTWVFEAFKVQ